jgi:hypothetical protein
MKNLKDNLITELCISGILKNSSQSRIPDVGGKKAPDPGCATLV